MPENILITGASTGIGRALAAHYLDAGARVFGLSRREPEGLARNPRFAFEPVDLADLDSISPAVARLLAPARDLDLVILNAARLGPIADMADADLDGMRKVMDVNVWANKPVLDAAFAGHRVVRQVVAISSGAAVSGSRGWNGYAISKAALNMLIKLYAAEHPETHFTAMAPGLADTGMQAAMRARAPDPRFATVERLRAAAGTPDMPTPEDLAPRLAKAFEAVRKAKSGAFTDLRDLD